MHDQDQVIAYILVVFDDFIVVLLQQHKEAPEPVILDKNEVKTILADSGVSNDRLSEFDRCYDETAGEAGLREMGGRGNHGEGGRCGMQYVHVFFL